MLTDQAQVLDALQQALPGRVETDPSTLEQYAADRSGHRAAAPPLAAVHARSVEDVQAACRIASEYRIPLVARGTGTGLAGGSIAGQGEVVLSLAGMDSILEISPENRLAVVQPGIINGELNRVLADHGLWWAPDPASKDICTVGGNIATNAGGLLCAKYGVTRESVLALKVVLADGTLLSVGHRTVKGVTGMDLCALMIGSEGTLGIVVEATLKLQPVVAGTKATLGAMFASLEQAADAATSIIAGGHQPAIMEMVDQRTLRAIQAHTGQQLAEDAGAFLLVQCDGPQALEQAQAIGQVASDAGGQVQVSDDPVESEKLFELRRGAFAALESQGTMLVEDMAVPRDKMAEAFRAIRAIEEKYQVQIPTTCHAGDGNLHPAFVYEGAQVPQNVWDAAHEMFRTALDLGGTLSGEHGIGLLKRGWLKDELGERQYQLQYGIKELFDPLGILNPGKVFTPATTNNTTMEETRATGSHTP
ncbi:FAD-binding oxidoreductase [Glutamicibacter arilaitensis]|uniref:FAD-binding oxidoreductase n=1 Tax=Glutamicibacter arilaitensis TaxID=256701 RepID=UPI003A92FD4C